MGILHGLERRLRGAFDTTFARLFGGSVQPAEVSAALQREAAAGVTHQSGRAVAPNRYTVELGPSDAADVGDDMRRVSDALGDMLGGYVRDQGWDTFANVQVTLRESDRLHTGQFRVSSIIDPSVGAGREATRYDVSPGGAPIAGRGQYGEFPDNYPEPPYPPQPYEQPYEQHHPQPSLSHAHQSSEPPPAAASPTLIVEDGTGRSYPLHRGSNVVGRGQTAALRLADTAVSREHLDVYFDGHSAIVHDLGSTNGTTVNGSPIQTWQLADGDVIRLGTSAVVFSAR